MQTCPTCGNPQYPGPTPPEPRIGTYIRDRFGGVALRHKNGNWAPSGCMPLALWDPMWAARGPLVECQANGDDKR